MQERPRPATAKGPDTTFTGDVWLDTIAGGDDESRLTASLVRFTPGARTHWHSHPVGQTLYCTDGEGLVVDREGSVVRLRPGLAVWTRPDEQHWHGGTRDHLMAHLSLVVADTDGTPARWLEAVTDEEYAAALEALYASL